MARIDTNNYYDLVEAAEILDRNVFTVRQWIKENMFDVKDVLVFEGEQYIKKSAVKGLQKMIAD